jgi:hypothetical protein
VGPRQREARQQPRAFVCTEGILNIFHIYNRTGRDQCAPMESAARATLRVATENRTPAPRRERKEDMNATSQIILRVVFVAMLIVGAACNKLDRSSLQANAAVESGHALTAEQAQAAEAGSRQALQARVEYLEAQLSDLRARNAKPEGSLAEYWD